MFKNKCGNIPGGNFLGGSFPDTEFFHPTFKLETESSPIVNMKIVYQFQLFFLEK